MDPERDYPELELEHDPAEEGGGPVKSFLEHLEDLRWTLIKSTVAIVVSMVVCMVAGKYLVGILIWPLSHSILKQKPDFQQVTIHLGTNYVGRLPATVFGMTNAITNGPVSFSLVPLQIGSNVILALQPETNVFVVSTVPQIKNYGPMSSVMVAMKLALYGGFILSAPFVILFVGQFVLPALHIHEKRILYQAVGFGAGLFVLGVLFCYFLIAGVALSASIDFANWLGFAADEWRAEDYISFVTKLMLGMGICFEIPVVILVLVKIGLLDYQKLAKFRSYAIVLNLVIGAVVTPSQDPFTMLLFAAPLHLLYEISVVVAWFWARNDRKKATAAEAEIDVSP